MHLHAGHTQDDFGVMGDRELDVFESFRSLAFVNEGRAGRQGEEGIIDRGHKISRINHRLIGPAAEPATGTLAQVVLLVVRLGVSNL